ncbi:MAG: hypothetical protein OHK0029_42650 [Armatimonadaceae bacterium]
MGLYAVLLLGLQPIGSLWSGIVAKFYGAPVPIAAGSLLLGIGAILVFVRYPRFRRMGTPLPERI